MLRKYIRFRFFLILMGGISVWIIILLPFVNAQTQYPETISVLEAAYNGEIQAFHSYMAYAENANSENYTNIAKLFVALAASEAIHAHNFKTLLSELGVEKLKHLLLKKILRKLPKLSYKRLIRNIPNSLKRSNLRSMKGQFVISIMHGNLKNNIES